MKKMKMMFIMKPVQKILMATAVAVACAVLPLIVSAADYVNIWYIPLAGKVGYHFVSRPEARCPGPEAWNSNYPTLEYNSSLPPGLELKGFNIEGTPTQPGSWYARVRFTNIVCGGKAYPDKVVDLDFYIER